MQNIKGPYNISKLFASFEILVSRRKFFTTKTVNLCYIPVRIFEDALVVHSTDGHRGHSDCPQEPH